MITRLIHWKKFIFLGIYALGFTGSIWVRLLLLCKRTQNLTIIDLKKHQAMQIYTWNSVTTRLIMSTILLINVISMEFLLRGRLPSREASWAARRRRDGCTLWRDKLLKMINIFMRCVAIKNRRLLNWPASWNLFKCRFMQIFFGTPYTFFILNF